MAGKTRIGPLAKTSVSMTGSSATPPAQSMPDPAMFKPKVNRQKIADKLRKKEYGW